MTTTKRDKAYIVGFMRSGKTTVAHALGTRIKWASLDLDPIILEAENALTVRSIFADRAKGERYFREVEHRELLKLVPRRNVIVAAGGGTFVQEQNRDVMLRDGTVIWLDVSFMTVLRRAEINDDRPLADEVDKMAALFVERLRLYQKAHERINVEGKSVPQIVDEILKRVPALMPA